MHKNRFSVLALASAAIFAVAVSNGGTYAADQIDIAIIVPLSGPNASVGEQAVNAAKLAVADVNDAGGINTLGGAKLNLIIADATNDPQGAINTSERVLSQNTLAGAYGLALSPLTTAALPAFVKHHVPVITSAISDTLVTPTNGGFLFQIAPKGSAFGNQQVEFLKFLNMKYKMAAMITTGIIEPARLIKAELLLESDLYVIDTLLVLKPWAFRLELPST